MPQLRTLLSIVGVTAIALGGVQSLTAEPPQRARPPVWTEDEQRLFPKDARKLLVGERPDFSVATPATSPVTPAGSAAVTSEQFVWSTTISPDTIETEIKRQANVVAGLVMSATAFKGGGYRECRDAFSTLALMFGIAAEHDGDVRWNDRAAGLSMLFARVGANCKVGTDASFREAAARSQDLTDLIRGGRPRVPPATDDRTLGQLADRSPVMRRMELAEQSRLPPLLANERSFSRQVEDVLHESQMLAALAEAITREGFDDADDEDYTAFARQLQDAAADLSWAAEQENYEAARSAFGRASQSCVACHENYRG